MYTATIAIFLVVNAVPSLGLMGIQNCMNKCDKVFDKTQYAISDQPGASTFEYRSCLVGCDRCQRQLAQSEPVRDDTCFNYCKRFNYGGAGIRKGVIEPDKACLMGCVINTCQEICWGGTTDQLVTDENRDQWWGLGGNGCSLKSGGGYVQNPQYGNPDQPIGTGGDRGIKICCANAYNLCYYQGDEDSINFQNVNLVARRTCKRYVPEATPGNFSAICDFYNAPRNCGTQGMGGV
jgi:hypothetical protein